MKRRGPSAVHLLMIAALSACDSPGPIEADGGFDADAPGDATADTDEGGAGDTLSIFAVCPRAEGPVEGSCVGLAEITVNDIQEEAVSFQGGSPDLTLEGALTVPSAEITAADGIIGSFPGVILVHDAGPQSRAATAEGQLAMDFLGREVPVFEEVSTALALQGFAVLRYDKRTCTGTEGCDNDYPPPGVSMGFWDLRADVEAAMAYLASRGDVVADDITLIGYGQGGQIVPFAAADDPAVRDLVLLSAPYSPVDELLAQQAEWARSVMEAEGNTEEEINAEIGELVAAANAVADLRTSPGGGTDILGRTARFWEEWMEAGDRIPAAVLELQTGLLVLHGDYDWTVQPAEAAAFENALSGATTASLVVLAELTHPLVRVSQPDFLTIEAADIGDGVDDAALATLVEWLTRRSQ